MNKDQNVSNEISSILLENGILDLSEKEKMLSLFESNTLVCKQIIRIIIKDKLCSQLNISIEDSAPIEDIFPTLARASIIKDLRNSTGLELPRPTMSDKKIKILLTYFFSAIIVLVVLFFSNATALIPFFLGNGLIGLVFIVLLFSPIMVFSFIRPGYFFGLDLPGIITFKDFLISATVDNFQSFREDKYSKLLDEIKKLLPAASGNIKPQDHVL